MQKCSARAIVTPSGSRSDDRRMQPNGAAMRFVPGSRVILQSSVLPPTLARLGRRRLPPDRSRPRRTRRRLLVSASLQFDFIVLRALRLEPIRVALIFRRKRQTKKPRRGEQPRGGVLWVRGGRRVTIHRADLRYAFIKRRWLSVRFATLEPGNRFDYAHVRPCRVPRRRGRRVSLEQHLLRRGARNEQPTWMTPRPAPPRSPLCARPCATAASRRRRGLWRA